MGNFTCLLALRPVLVNRHPFCVPSRSVFGPSRPLMYRDPGQSSSSNNVTWSRMTLRDATPSPGITAHVQDAKRRLSTLVRRIVH
jgi:hypothetical protein